MKPVRKILPLLGVAVWLGIILAVSIGIIGSKKQLDEALAARGLTLAQPLERKLERIIAEETGYEISSHERSEGPSLMASFDEHESVLFSPVSCPANAPVKTYDLASINVTIILNRWGDRDPLGYMYAVRDHLPAIRAQETTGEDGNFGLGLGVGGDAIQPLTIRGNVGDCVRISLINELDEPASFHVHGADLILAATGEPALSTNSDSMAMPGEKIIYEWYIDPEHYTENTHYVHSHGAKARFQAGHGLFGAFIVEPAGSEYLDNQTGQPLCNRNGNGDALECGNSWDAMISPGDGSSDFREFTMFYHEIGNAQFAAADKEGVPLPSIDPVLNSYKPSGRAINYRSESFFRRMGEIDEQVPFYKEWKHDEAEAYSSYVFGDPAMPVPQSYVGDPVKYRLLHGGSETFHVPHLHGGGIQWQRQSDVGKEDGASDFVPIDEGLRKHFENTMASSGNDSQTIGPSESYELEIGCGSGGCQQTVGDFLFHCHVASHYISGMWHFWRVYNTLQDDVGKTDELAVVAELPDRQGGMEHAVTSTELIGQTVTFSGRDMTVNESLLHTLVQLQLPPQGITTHEQDASVMDWAVDETLYLNEPETRYSWPNFTSPNPGERFALKFNPATAKLAFPFLRPHLGKRPPFAPHHGPAPFLEPFNHPETIPEVVAGDTPKLAGDTAELVELVSDDSSTDDSAFEVAQTRNREVLHPLLTGHSEPAPPGLNGEYSLCPQGAPLRFYNIHAIQTPIPVNAVTLDSDGMIMVLKENEERARNNPDFKVPIAIRANQGDCVDIFFTNELDGTDKDHKGLPNLMKTNIHIHFVQFDTQASDGVITGQSYEQAPRPFTAPGMSAKIQEVATRGSVRLSVNDASLFHPGSTVAVGIDEQTDILETAVIEAISGNELIFRRPLRNDHVPGELVSNEFVRYRWYVARQNGAIYFHDHVDALNRWGHGLFGALIAEPTGSTYHDPKTGEEILSGPIADIRLDPNRGVLPGLEGSFREYVLFMNDRNQMTGSTFNLRAEPLRADTKRGQGPTHLALSSVMHGDPATPVLRSYVGDPILFRLLTSATEEIHPFHITGHHFRQERFQGNSPPLTVFGVGISERFNAYVEAAGGAARKAGDYLYYNGSERHFREGSWGILRVHDTLQANLQPLPGREPPSGQGFPLLTFTGEAPPRATDPGNPCVAGAPHQTFNVSAIDQRLVFNADAGLGIPTGRIYVLDQDLEAVQSGARRPEPLVIRANAGDCITVSFTNRSSQPASFHVDSPTFDPQGSLGITLGYNPDQVALPGEHINYTFYAEDELGVVLARDFGNLFRNAREGLYGALVVEPEGSTYHDPYTGEPLESGVAAVIQNPNTPDFREFVTVFQDNDPDIGLFLMPYDQDVNKLVGINYRAEPLTLRLALMGMLLDADPLRPEDFKMASSLYDSSVFGEPATNVFETFGGDPVRFRVVSGYSEQSQVFSVEGHQWQLTPQIKGSDVVSSRYLPPTGVLNANLMATGGPQGRPGDYKWGNHRLPFEKAGQWGLMRVYGPGTDTRLRPLSDR